MSFTFDKETHIYKNKGIAIPGVTQILADNGLISPFCKGSEYARRKGEVYHKCLELFNKGTLDWDSISPELIPLVKSWEKFLSDHQATVIPESIEYMGASTKYVFGFRLDVIVNIKGKNVLVDYKSGAIGKSTKFQTAAYKMGWEENNPNTLINYRAAFHPIDENSYKLENYRDKQDEYDFITLTKATNIRKKMQ